MIVLLVCLYNAPCYSDPYKYFLRILNTILYYSTVITVIINFEISRYYVIILVLLFPVIFR